MVQSSVPRVYLIQNWLNSLYFSESNYGLNLIRFISTQKVKSQTSINIFAFLTVGYKKIKANWAHCQASHLIGDESAGANRKDPLCLCG